MENLSSAHISCVCEEEKVNVGPVRKKKREITKIFLWMTLVVVCGIFIAVASTIIRTLLLIPTAIQGSIREIAVYLPLLTGSFFSFFSLGTLKLLFTT